MIRIVALSLILATPLAAAPNAQFTSSIAHRLDRIGIHVVPEHLTTSQAAALHMMLVSTKGWIDKRRKAQAILRNPAYLD